MSGIFFSAIIVWKCLLNIPKNWPNQKKYRTSTFKDFFSLLNILYTKSDRIISPLSFSIDLFPIRNQLLSPKGSKKIMKNKIQSKFSLSATVRHLINFHTI